MRGTPSRCAHKLRDCWQGQVPATRSFEEIREKPARVAPRGASFSIFHNHRGILRSWISFAITALIERNSCREGRASFAELGDVNVSADKLCVHKRNARRERTSPGFFQGIGVVVRSILSLLIGLNEASIIFSAC
jgi:hypothetical protein